MRIYAKPKDNFLPTQWHFWKWILLMFWICPKTYIVPFLDLLHGCQNTDTCHLTVSLRPNSSWTPQSSPTRRASHPHKHTLLYHSLLWLANLSIQLWCCRSDKHKVCGCAPFVHLITKAAMHADSKNRWCTAKPDKRENKGIKWTDSQSRRVSKLAQFPFHYKKHIS